MFFKNIVISIDLFHPGSKMDNRMHNTTPDLVGFSVCSCSEAVAFSASFQTVWLTLAKRPHLAGLASGCKSLVGSVVEVDKLRAVTVQFTLKKMGSILTLTIHGLRN